MNVTIEYYSLLSVAPSLLLQVPMNHFVVLYAVRSCWRVPRGLCLVS